MFKKKVLFVVGAGASNEYGFPLGWELLRDIGNATSPDDRRYFEETEPLVNFLIQSSGISPNEYIDALRMIRVAIPYSNSIDDFLHQRRDNPALIMLGKALVASLILEYERNSALGKVYRGEMKLSFISDKTWLFPLAKMLFKGVRPSDVSNVFENVSFISFNYDRSVEMFFSHALADHFSIDLGSAGQIVGRAPICHVYGSVGRFLKSDPSLNIAFGERLLPHTYDRIVPLIRTYTESATDTEVDAFVRAYVPNAERIVFLGCGYHEQNVSALQTGGGAFAKTIIGTTKGMSDIGASIAEGRVTSLLNEQFHDAGDYEVNLVGQTAAELLQRYSMALPL